MTSFVEQCTWINFVREIDREKQQKVADLRSYEPGGAWTGAGPGLDTTAATIASLRREIDSLDEAAMDARRRIVVPLHVVA